MRAQRLIDEGSRPGLRTVWGDLLSHATAVDVAVTHVRLSTLGFTEAELVRVQRIRVLLAELSAASLDAQARAVWERPDGAPGLARLLALLEHGRIAVRSAPLGGWSPDFSVFHDDGGPRILLVGPHSFDLPGPLQGPLFVSRHGKGAAARAGHRFASLWARGHDVRGAVAGILSRARPVALEPPGSVASQGVWSRRRPHPRLDTPVGRG